MMFPKPHTVRLKGKAYTAFRKAVHDRARGMCEQCGLPAPLLDDGKFNLYTCGHVSHRKSRGAFGGDTLDNAEWKCYWCHIVVEHNRGKRGGENGT